MKKTLLLFLSLALLLTMGAFVVKAVTQEAFTTNSFNFSGANLNNYVQDDVYKYICKSNECIQVKQATIKPSDGDYFNTKNDCLKKCNANPASVSTGGSATGGLNFNLNSAFTSPSSKPAVGSVSTGGSSLQGLSFADPSAKPFGGTASGTAGSIAKPSTNFGGLSFNTPTAKPSGGSIPGVAGGVTPNSLFGTGLQYSGSSATPQGGTTIPKNEATFFGSLLQKFGLTGAKTDEATPDVVVGPGDADYKDFEFTASSSGGSVSDAKGSIKIKMGETVTLKWNAQADSFKSCKAVSGSTTKTMWPESNIGLSSEKTIPNTELVTTSTGKSRTFDFNIECSLLGKEKEVSKKIRVTVTKGDDNEPPTDPKKLSVKITAAPEAVTLKEGKASSKISWVAENAVSCSTKAVEGVTGWTASDKLDVKSKSPVEVSFAKEGSYTFEIICLDSNKKEDKDAVKVTVSKDGEKPPEPGKPEQGALGDYKNDCAIEIDKDTFDYNIVNRDQAANVKITFACKGKAKEESGHDVRPIGYGLFVNETVGSQTKRYDCKEVPSPSQGKYLDKPETITLSCDFKNDKKFDGLFDMDEQGNNKNQNQKMLIAYARFYTNQDDGSYWAGKYSNEPRIDQENATRTPHLSFTGGKGKPGPDKSMFVQANKKDIASTGETVSITAGAKGYKACKVTSDGLKDLNFSLTGTEEKLSLAPTPFAIPANLTKTPKNYYLNITCDDIKGNPFMITVAAKEDPTDPGDNSSANCNDNSQRPKACTIVPTISTPVVEINKASKTGGEIRGSVLISNCNWGNTGKIFLTAGLRMDGLNTPMAPVSGKQITSALDRNWTIKWSDLPPVTQKNILNTFDKKDSKGEYYSAVTIPFQYYSGQSIGSSKATKDNTCGWVDADSSRVLSVTFKVKGAGNDDGNTNDSSAVTKCKKVCKDNFDKLPESDLIATYKGNSKQEAYQNCIAKCEDKPIPFPETKSPKKEPQTEELSGDCSYVTLENKNLTNEYIPEAFINIKDKTKNQGIVEVKGYLDIDNEKINLPTWTYQGYPKYPEGVSTLAYITHINTNEVFKTLNNKLLSKSSNAKMVLYVYTHDFNANKKILCNTHNINLPVEGIGNGKQTCEFAVYGGQTLQLFKSNNGDFRNVDYPTTPALVVFPYGSVTKCSRNMSNFNFEITWDQKTSDVQKFSAVDCSRSCFKELAYKFDRSKANIFAQKAMDLKGQGVYAGKLTIKLVNTVDKTFSKTLTQDIFFRYPPGQPTGQNVDVPVAKNLCSNGYPIFTYGYTHGYNVVEKSKNFSTIKPTNVAPSTISSALKIDFKGCSNTSNIKKATVSFLKQTGSIIVNPNTPNILPVNANLEKQSTLKLCFDKDGGCNYNCTYSNNGEQTTSPKCVNPN